jgi:catecholate siderophore receptor
MIHGDVLKNHRDFYDGDRLGINPTLAIQVSDRTTLDLAYEYADHERYVDRGIPTENGKPVKRFSNITFGDSKGGNFSLLEADIFRATLSTDYSNTTKGNLAIISSEFKKMYQNYYVAEYSAGESVVTVDGYKDPTERDNTIISANLINELEIGSTTHTLLFGVEVIDTFNKNERYDAYWSTSMSDTETFNIKRPINFLLNSSGFSTINDFNTDLNSQTQSEIEVTSFFFQDQIDVSKYLKLLIGGRHDNFNITVKDLKNGTAQAREDTEFSPRAGIIFKPTEKASFYFSYSESFLPRSGEQFKSLSPISAALDPDIFESSEIGIKMDVSDNLNFTLAYFDSEQLIAARDSMSGETSEIVGLQVDGLELEVKGEINNRMNVVFGYSSLDGRTFKGGEPREIPDSTLSLFATYEVSDNFSWALGYIQQGESNIANDNPDLILPKFTRVDLGAYYQMTSDFSIQINIENLMDELYFPYSHSTHQVSVGEPLNIRVSARKTF